METAQALLKKFKDVKTLPHVAIQLNRLLADPNSTISEFEKLIELDPTLVLRLLRIVNSPFYGLRQEVDNISRAVMLLGIRNLHSMLIADALKGVFKKGEGDGEGKGFSRTRLWLHSVAVSVCSKMITEQIFGEVGDTAYLCGILHEIGIIVEDQTAPDLLLQVCKSGINGSGSMTEYERKILGTDHTEVGALLAEAWGLTADVQNAIRHHHDMDDITPDSIPGIIQISDYLVSGLQYPAVNGVNSLLAPDLSEFIKSNANEFKAIMQDLPEAIAEAGEIFNT